MVLTNAFHEFPVLAVCAVLQVELALAVTSPADGGAVGVHIAGDEVSGSLAVGSGGEGDSRTPGAEVVGTAVVAHPDIILGLGFEAERVGGLRDAGDVVVVGGQVFFGRHSGDLTGGIVELIALVQGVACNGIPASGSLSAGDGVGSHSEAGGRHVTSEGGEGDLGGAPGAVVVIAAVGADIGVVGGTLVEVFFDGEGIGVSIDDVWGIVRVEVFIGAVGNLPIGLTFSAVGPAQSGGVSGLGSAGGIGDRSASGSKRHLQVVYAAAILTAVVPTENQPCGVVRNTAQVVGATFYHSAAVSDCYVRNGSESIESSIIFISDVTQCEGTVR